MCFLAKLLRFDQAIQAPLVVTLGLNVSHQTQDLIARLHFLSARNFQ